MLSSILFHDRTYLTRFKFTRVLFNAELQSYFLKCVLIKVNQERSDFLMVLSYCGFYLMQFWLQFFIQKKLDRNVF